MEIFPIETYVATGPAAVALGNFDGVHKGHQTLLLEAVTVAKAQGLSPMVYTFREHPANLLTNQFVVPYITTNAERMSLFEEIGMDTTVLDPFSKELSSLSPTDFFHEILVKSLHARHIVCGFHYHFGSKGAGDAKLLEKLCREQGMGISILPPYKKQDRVVSSTWVRECVGKGEVDKAMELMGHPYLLTNTVEHGAQLGRTLGVPTINQMFPVEKIQPAKGVYYTKLCIDGTWYKGATNVGMRPTVHGEFLNCETHILDFSGDLYGETITLQFQKHLRSEFQFVGVQQLRTQLHSDVQTIREYPF